MQKAEYKAKKTGFVRYDKYANFVEYEYRGRTYDVEYSKNWTYVVAKPWEQHKYYQEQIDEQIEIEERDAKRESEPADVAFDKFWNYVENDILPPEWEGWKEESNNQ